MKKLIEIEMIPRFENSAVLYLGVSFVAFFPSLIMGYYYFDGDLLIYSSIIQQFLKNSLLQGQLPLWNPYIFGGQPFLADPTSLMFYPLWYFSLLFPPAYGFGFFCFFHLFLAALGMHFWLKNLELSKRACWVGSLSFALSGFFWSEIIHLPSLAALAWTPWFLGCLEKWAKDLKPSSAFFSGLTFAMLFLVGFFQMTLGALYLGISYFIYRVLTLGGLNRLKQPGKSAVYQWKKSILSGAFFLWACLPLFALWLPASEFVSFSDRVQSKLPYETFNAGLSLKLETFTQFLFPLHPDHLPNGKLNDELYLSNAGYLGIWVPFLILMALRGKNKNLVFFLGAASLTALLICLGKYTPVHQWFCDWIPGFDLLRSPFRFLHIYATCVPIIIAIGFETLTSSAKKNEKNAHASPILWGAAYGSAILIAAISGIQQVWDQIWFLAPGGLGLFLWLQTKRWSRTGEWIFIFSIFLSLLVTAWSSSTSRLGPADNFDFNKESPLISRIKDNIGNARVFVGDNIPYSIKTIQETSSIDFPTNAACLFGLRNVGGYNPLSLFKRGELHQLPFITFCRLMAVQGFVTGNEKGEIPGFKRILWDQTRFYKANEERPFVYAPGKVTVILDDKARLEAMKRIEFNPYQQAYLDKNPPVSLNGPQAKLEYQWLEDKLNQQSFRIKLDISSWVVISEANYPGWEAWVDGKPASIVTSNYLFRGLFIPSGVHEVKFLFQPPWFKVILAGALFWMVISGFLVLKIFKTSHLMGL